MISSRDWSSGADCCFSDEVLMHHEYTKEKNAAGSGGLPLIRYTTGAAPE
jgi:hypothetical protein